MSVRLWTKAYLFKQICYHDFTQKAIIVAKEEN